jgi:hypothetical protein
MHIIFLSLLQPFLKVVLEHVEIEHLIEMAISSKDGNTNHEKEDIDNCLDILSRLLFLKTTSFEIYKNTFSSDIKIIYWTKIF